MKRFLITSLLILLASCNGKINQEDLIQLNGYWEIEKVILASGELKEYKINTTVDYIQIEKDQGFRKKVYPKLDGSFDTTDDAKKFSVIDSSGVLLLSYENSLSSWKEQLLTLDKNSFSVKNEEEITYYYKKFIPINITP